MDGRNDNPTAANASRGRFLIGPPHDSEALLELFSLVLERAESGQSEGMQFGIPYAAFLRLANHNQPSVEDLSRFCREGNSASSEKQWPASFWNPSAAVSRAPDKSRAMYYELLQFALDSGPHFNLDGPCICRVLAAVGQTLAATDQTFRRYNRRIAAWHRAAAAQRLTPPVAVEKARLSLLAAREDLGQITSSQEQGHVAENEEPGRVIANEEPGQIVVTTQAPWQLDFRRSDEEAACLRLNGLTVWHATSIGPRSAEKSENEDATYAMTNPEMSSPPVVGFALADGVSTSLGSRLAATSIVRRFCEVVLQQMTKGERVTGRVLIEAARQTQVSLDELTQTLLHRVNSFGFEAMLGSELKREVATRLLENTLEPKVAAMPAALNATLIGGVVQPNGTPGVFQIEVIRIGDGSVEHIDADGNLTSMLDTDPNVMQISESLGPGPQSRALFEQSETTLPTTTVMLCPGESLIVSSDGLVRGHDQPITRKLEQLLGKQFWNEARPDEADAALKILRRACHSADELFLQDSNQSLFADNVSIIVIRSGD